MMTISKGFIAAGLLATLAGGVLVWQFNQQIASPKNIVSAEAASGPSIQTGSSGGAGAVGGGRPMPPVLNDVARAAMELNSATPSDEKMKFGVFDAILSQQAFERIAQIREDLPSDWRLLQQSWQAFMEPVVANDAAGFADLVTRLGGVAPAATRVHEMVSRYLGGASIAWDHARVRKANAEGGPSLPVSPRIEGMESARAIQGTGSIPIMATMNRSQDSTGMTMSTRTINLPLAGVFPDVEGAREVYEVWVPAQMSSSKGDLADCGISVFMARVENRWQPAAVRIGLRSEKANEMFGQSMQINRERAAESGGVLRMRAGAGDAQTPSGGE